MHVALSSCDDVRQSQRVDLHTAADLGMFSMFGRTGAPQKGAPIKGAATFLHAGNNGRHTSERVK